MYGGDFPAVLMFDRLKKRFLGYMFGIFQCCLCVKSVCLLPAVCVRE